MFDEILTKIFGSRNDRLIKQYRRKCEAINKLEPAMKALSDEALQAKTQEFRERIAKGETTDDLLPEAFAVVREAAVRVLGMRHYDVQLIGGMVLNDGKIAEMRTGEGKTLTATLAVYLNALPGKGCHVVTVNDYLASRDADWMGRLYNWLGLSVGKILTQQDNETKRAAYAADITYGTNNEFGFDYLRDNMEYDVRQRRQRGLYYAIVDEVDSILIDEARTPLIISGPANDNTDLYVAINEIPPLLTRQAEEKGEGDYWVDEKAHQVYISEAGHEKLEAILAERGLVAEGETLYSPKNIILMHHLMASLKAHTLFKRDQHYVVQNGEIVIVDEFTGRLMPGRRWSEGLHQAVEAKEGVKIQQENQTMASITFQNYFRMYQKLSGMTGTADTEAYEFQDIYGLETVVIPTHRTMIRVDEQDKVYRTVKEKYAAIIEDVKRCHEKNQPVLLGTTSIENSEGLWLAVAENPYVDCIGHSEQQNYRYDYDLVTKAFAKNHKVVELNGNSVNVRRDGIPNMKLLLAACLKNGCHIALDTDAHSTTQLQGNMPPLLAMLEEMQFPQELVVNATRQNLVNELKLHGRICAEYIGGEIL